MKEHKTKSKKKERKRNRGQGGRWGGGGYELAGGWGRGVKEEKRLEGGLSRACGAPRSHSRSFKGRKDPRCYADRGNQYGQHRVSARLFSRLLFRGHSILESQHTHLIILC